jgi:hypothetical protein
LGEQYQQKGTVALFTFFCVRHRTVVIDTFEPHLLDEKTPSQHDWLSGG